MKEKQKMSFKQPGYLRQTWWVIKYAVQSWLEWQDAKCWARVYRPGWLHVVKKCKHEETQSYYKAKILAAYRGEDYD